MKRRTFIQSIIGFLSLPFVPKSKAKLTPLFEDLDPYPQEFKEVSGINEEMLGTKPKLQPGQIWEDTYHIFHCEENLRFALVLLSADKEDDGKLYWKTAEFMQYKYGAQIRYFKPEEISKFRYMGNIQLFK